MSAFSPFPRRKDGGVEAPVSLLGLFNEGSDDDSGGFVQEYEEQSLQLLETSLIIRQYSWHEANANKVWPGTFTLAEFMMRHKARFVDCSILELGAATGCLSIYLSIMLQSHQTSLVTSDIDDGGEVEANIQYNFLRNGLLQPIHVPYTWGNRWPHDRVSPSSFLYVIASDILLYVKAYPQLVQSLVVLFDGGTIIEFIMSWQRRIADSVQFFELMKMSNFICYHHGQCIYSFFRKQHEAEIMFTYGIS